MIRKCLITAGFILAAGCVVAIADSLATPTRECPYCDGTARLSTTKENSAFRFDHYACTCGGVCWDRVSKTTGVVERFPLYDR